MNAYWLPVVILLVAGCQRQKSGAIIARVGDATLTMEEARKHIDTAQLSSAGQLRGYATLWVNDELLYQEAIHSGLEKTEDIQEQLRDTRREIISSAFLRRMLDQDSIIVRPDEISEYYKRHAAEFFIREDMIQANLLTMNSRERASAFAALVTRGTSWNTALNQLLHDTVASKMIVSSSMGNVFSQQMLYPNELWKVAQTLETNEVSFPINIGTGYSIVQLLARYPKGSPAPLELAQDEVRQRLLIEHRRNRMTELLGTLRAKYPVELMIGSGSSDTTQTLGHE